MIFKIGDNIISSLGFTTEENFDAVKQCFSGVKHFESGTFNLPEAFMAALIDKERLNDEFSRHGEHNYTNLEKAAILSICAANQDAKIDLSNENTIFILSTTKGNVDILDTRLLDTRRLDMRGETEKNLTSHVAHPPLRGGLGGLYLWHTAELIATFFGNTNTPIVVSNACISGAAAQVVAMRELESGNYDYAVVVGTDFLSKFIISGFQSFKALSPERCRPFDKERYGLNLGEAAATMIFAKDTRRLDTRLLDTRPIDTRPIDTRQIDASPLDAGHEGVFSLVAGAVRNDATHISAPSRTGEGSFRALQHILTSHIPLFGEAWGGLSHNLTSHIAHRTSHIAFINAHGTATPYNDAAEMHAIARAGLGEIPVNSLKAYFGHTLGAAGVLESIISMRALSEGMILKSLEFEQSEELIIDNKPFTLNVCRENMTTDKKYFIKMMSGFGGCNAALMFKISHEIKFSH
ncbi:MAG: beta-ketoacyl synthase [Bacteroidales bacterium]|nr:beta-ketoacyl synthase [Bacteroidales bacterium]